MIWIYIALALVAVALWAMAARDPYAEVSRIEIMRRLWEAEVIRPGRGGEGR